jgi:hypothetical protein
MDRVENFWRTIRHDNPEYVLGDIPSVWYHPPVTERTGQAGPDDWGVMWSLEEGAEGGTYPTVGGHTVTDLSKWRQQVHIPDVDAMDWAIVHEQSAKHEAELATLDEPLLKEGFVEFGVYERSYLLLGMEEALIAYLTEPDLMAELAEAIADYKVKLITRFCEEAGGLDIVWYGDDWGNQSQLFLPPDVWRKIIKPQTKRVYDAIHACGALVNQHSCGKIDEVFGDMVEIGCDIFNPCQPCNDLAGLKKKFPGKITFNGAIDSQFVLDRPGVTCEEVRAEVRHRIDTLAEGGGYIAGPSHGVPYDEDIINAMHDEIATYGRAFYAADNN